MEDFGEEELRNRLETHSGIQNVPTPYSEKGGPWSEEKNIDNDTETCPYKG